MALRDVKHTDAEEQRAFEALSIEEKWLEIWLNGRETNGAVAQAFVEIAKLQAQLELELQQFSVNVDAKIASLEIPKLAQDVVALKRAAAAEERLQIETLAVTRFIKRWGAWGTAAILAAITAGQQLNVWDQLWEVIK